MHRYEHYQLYEEVNGIIQKAYSGIVVSIHSSFQVGPHLFYLAVSIAKMIN